MAKDRVERDEEDLVRLYLTDIGQYTLLTKDDEVRLAKQIEAGKAAIDELDQIGKDITAAKKRELRRAATRGRGRRTGVRAVQPASGGVDRQEVPGVRPAAARPHPGGQPRADARRREVRLAQGLQVLDVRHVVDPPGHHPRHRQHRPHHPPASARRRHAGPPAEGPQPARAEARPPGHVVRAGQRSRDARGQGHRGVALRRRAVVAQRAAPRRRRRRAGRRRRRPFGRVARSRLPRRRCCPRRSPACWHRSTSASARSSSCASVSTAASRARSKRSASTSTSPASASARSRHGR